MSKNWIGMIVLVGMSTVVGSLFSQIWEPAHGQPVGFSLEAPVVAPQVVVQQPTEFPKCFVDFVSLPPQPGKPEVRVITVVDIEAKRIAVYHLNMADGGLWLLSSRNIQPDLMVDQYNPRPPFPSDIVPEMQRLGKISSEQRRL